MQPYPVWNFGKLMDEQYLKSRREESAGSET